MGVPVEIVGAFWPLAATMAVLVGARVREVRHRLRLNRALHELRRPLQALALALADRDEPALAGTPSSLDLAMAALEDLDGAVNGSDPAIHARPVACRALVAGAVERWRGPAARAGRSLVLEWRAGAAIVDADPARVSQALDNLIANALEHGGLRVRVEVSISAVGVRIVVANRGVATRAWRRDPRRGHGLEVVRRTAAAHGGRFALGANGAEVVAALELPLAPMPPPAAPLDWASRALASPPPPSVRGALNGTRRAGQRAA
jgi:two-component system, OmpR family, sensor histidine kinase BaeS